MPGGIIVNDTLFIWSSVVAKGRMIDTISNEKERHGQKKPKKIVMTVTMPHNS